jgi:hypothetical protein
MNVLFDNGLSFDKRLSFEDANPFSEAFTFFKPIDNIWGDFTYRKLEKNETADSKKVKESYYLRQIKGDKINLNPLSKAVDLAQIFPQEENLLSHENVLGLAFDIYEKKVLNELSKGSREITSSYFIKLRLVVKKELNLRDYPSTLKEEIDQVSLDQLVAEEHKHFQISNFDLQSMNRISPTLVLNKKTVLGNRNYTAEWKVKPKGFNNKEFDAERYWGFPSDTKAKMIVRIGKVEAKYFLYLHGDQEAGCPIRIPIE